MRIALKTVALILVIIATVLLLLRTYSLIHLGLDAQITYKGTQMRQGHFLAQYIIPAGKDPLTATLLEQSSDVLWGLLYASWGLVGSYMFYLYAMLKPKIEGRGEGASGVARFAVRSTLAALCGVVCFFLVRVLVSPIGKAIWIPPKSDARALTTDSVSESFIFLPILAGMFLDSFLGHLHDLLAAFMNWFKRPLERKQK